MTPQSATSETRSHQVDDLFQDFQGSNTPGASVLVMHHSEVLYKKSYGLADVEQDIAAQPNTNFRLASVTKHMTATAIMILKERGLLSYDDRLGTYFPEFPAIANQITLKHLLHHQSGLMDYEDLIPTEQTTQVKDRDVRALIAQQSSTYFEPGSQYRYSNGGYVLLGLIVEAVSGQTFAQFLKSEVFSPLKMHNTLAFEDGLSTIANRAFGYSPKGQTFERTDQSVTSATLGDGGVYSSVDDLQLWTRELTLPTLVSAESQAEAFTPGRLNNGDVTAYGFGWMINKYRDLNRHSHTGGTIGFKTAIQRFPDQDFTVVVLCNRSNATPWIIAEKIADIFLFEGRPRSSTERTDSSVIPQ